MNKDLKKGFARCLCCDKTTTCSLFRGNRIEEFNSWFKENTPKEGLSKDTTFTKQFIKDAWDNGYSAGYDKANKWHSVKDGDLPEVDNKIVLCICGDGYIDGKEHRTLKLLTRKEFKLFQTVYAWKEITLPKEN